MDIRGRRTLVVLAILLGTAALGAPAAQDYPTGSKEVSRATIMGSA